MTAVFGYPNPYPLCVVACLPLLSWWCWYHDFPKQLIGAETLGIRLKRALKPSNVPVALTIALLVSTIAIIIYGIFHTFDWSDEAWTISLISNARNTIGEPWAYQFLMHPVFALMGENIVLFRFLKLFAYIVLAVVAAFVIIKILNSAGVQTTRKQKLTVLAVAQMGTILIWTWPPRYFAYNELSSLLVQLVALLLALTLFLSEKSSMEKLRPITDWVIWLFIGLASGLLFYAKFTAFFVVIPTAFIVALVLIRTTRWRSLSAFLIAFVAGFLGPIWAGLPFVQYVHSVYLNVFDETVQAANAHPPSLAQMYLNDLITIVLTAFPVAVVFMGGLLLLLPVVREKVQLEGILPRFGLVVLAFVSFATVMYVITPTANGDRSGRLAIVMIVAAVAITTLFVWKPLRKVGLESPYKPSFKSWVGAFLIIVSGIVVSLGTNNPLSYHFGFGSTVWAAAFGGSLVLLQRELTRLAPKFTWISTVAVIITIFLGFLFAVKDARAPYRSASFGANNVATTVGGVFAGMYLTPSEVRLQQWLADEAKALDATDTATIALKSPGSLLVFNNSDFASPWLEAFWPASFWSINEACKPETPSRLLILIPALVEKSSAEYQMLSEALEEGCGLDFPSDFEIVAEHESTDPAWSMRIFEYAGVQ